MFKQRVQAQRQHEAATPGDQRHGGEGCLVEPKAPSTPTSPCCEAAEVEEEEEPLESVLARVPRDPEGQPTSIGSIRHALGDCRPCAYSGSSHRPCINSVRCLFCHLQHTPKRRIRLCRRKRLEMRAAVEAIVAGAGVDGLVRPPRYVPVSWRRTSS